MRAAEAGYGGANPDEARWCVGHLYWCQQFQADASKALRLAERLFTGRLDARKSDNTRANAFQHGFWVSLMGNSRTSEGKDPALAREEYALHEYHAFERSPDGPSTSAVASRRSRMDMINRINGRYIDPDIDPIAWWYRTDGAGSVVWRQRYTLDDVLVEPTGFDCAPA